MPNHRPDTSPPAPPAQRPIAALLGVVALGAYLVGCGDARPLDGRAAAMHPAGFADDHSAALRATGWDPAPCLACHADEGPGACTDCHEDGPDACDVCHRAPDPPHRAHAGFDCVTCHPVPAERATPGHIEDRAEDVRFSGLAQGAGHRPAYVDGRCSDTACHGGVDALTPSPAWGGRLMGGCAACHGLPPTDHPNDRCDRCHGDVVDAAGAIVDPALHLDGEIQALDWRALPCDGCHGGPDAGPPPDLDGRVDPAARGVGAHDAHRAPASAAPVPCSTCHVVPARNDAPGHLDDATPGAEVVFSGAGDTARYVGGQCADTRCHGPDRPNWTGDAPCGTCHGLPPAEHPPGDCARCHPTAAPDLGIARPAAHIDGRVDVEDLGPDDCAGCHDDGRVVLDATHGAHGRYACTTCHRAVAEDDVAAHLDGDPSLHLAGYAAGRCADDACHGIGQPVWGEPATIGGCGGCHGLPPADHSEGACDDCHPPADDPRHVDGRVDVVAPDDCDRCHGQPESGAHLAHAAPFLSAPVPCAACHAVPETVTAPGHFGPPPAEVALAVGAYADGRCSDTTCHAGPGARQPTPAWNDEGFICGDCHGTPPPGHLDGACALCHSAVADGDVIHTPARHVDGRVDFR